MGCDSSRVLGFGVLSSSGFSIPYSFFFLFSFFLSFYCDRCLKEDVGMAEIGGFGSVEIGVFLGLIGAVCGASLVAPTVVMVARIYYL